MDFVNGSELAFLQAALAQGVLGYIAVAYALPSPTVLLVHVWGAFIPVVVPAGLLSVFVTILSVTKVRTAGEGTGALWFSRHTIHLPSLYKKSSRGNPREPFLFSFPIIMIP